MSIDSIGNFLTIIRNGILITKPSVKAPHSKMALAIATLLKDEGFIRDVTVVQDANGRNQLHVALKYVDGESVIHEIKRVSKPSRRSYAGSGRVQPVIGGLGLSILSTDRGVITSKTAKAQNVGGEIICTVW